VIDFDQITRDPEHSERLLPAFDSGDHLHPSPVGYAAMAQAVPISLFAPTGTDDCDHPRRSAHSRRAFESEILGQD